MCCERSILLESGKARPWRKWVTCVEGMMLNRGVVGALNSRRQNSLDKVRGAEGGVCAESLG